MSAPNFSRCQVKGIKKAISQRFQLVSSCENPVLDLDHRSSQRQQSFGFEAPLGGFDPADLFFQSLTRH